jgi:hypothetical protein
VRIVSSSAHRSGFCWARIRSECVTTLSTVLQFRASRSRCQPHPRFYTSPTARRIAFSNACAFCHRPSACEGSPTAKFKESLNCSNGQRVDVRRASKSSAAKTSGVRISSARQRSTASARIASAFPSSCVTPKRGRKPVVTPERVQLICQLLARGESEQAACLRAGIGLTAWSAAKRKSADLCERIASAREDWARLRHAQHAAALYASQSARDASRKALKPRPICQAKLVVWHLTTRVPLNVVAIPQTEIERACEQFNLSLDTWQRQERAFGLLKKVYAKRAAIRGQQQQQQQQRQTPQPNFWPGAMFQDSEDEYY